MRKCEETMLTNISKARSFISSFSSFEDLCKVRKVYNCGGNTTVTVQDGLIYIKLHGNKIACIGGGLSICSGGYQSNTTKSRLNAILSHECGKGFSVFQKNFQWYINADYGTNYSIPEVIEFESGWNVIFN